MKHFVAALLLTLAAIVLGCNHVTTPAPDAAHRVGGDIVPTQRIPVEGPDPSRLVPDELSLTRPDLILLHDYDGDLEDASRLHHDGIAFGAPGFAPVCHGQALALDGVNDGVRVESAPDLQPEVVSVEVRFMPAHALTNGTTFVPLVVKLPYPYNFGNTVDGYDIAYQDPFGTGGRIGFGIGSQEGRIRVHASFNTSLDAEHFHYVVGTYDGKAIRLYLDGRLVATRSYDQPIAYLGGPIQVGGNIRHYLLDPSLQPFFFAGQIDFVAIHARALSADEIARRARILEHRCDEDHPGADQPLSTNRTPT